MNRKWGATCRFNEYKSFDLGVASTFRKLAELIADGCALSCVKIYPYIPARKRSGDLLGILQRRVWLRIERPLGEANFSISGMAQGKLGAEFLGPLFRFAWALTGDEMGATALTQNVVGDDSWRSVEAGGSRATEVALFSTAHRLFTSGEPMPIPPPNERVATISKLSLQHADRLTSDSLLRSDFGMSESVVAATDRFARSNKAEHFSPPLRQPPLIIYQRPLAPPRWS